MSIGTYVAYSITDDDDDDRNDSQNQKCYHAGFEVDRVARTIKLNKAIAVTADNITLMHITRALFKVAYHQVEEVILHVMIKLVVLPNSFYFYVF